MPQRLTPQQLAPPNPGVPAARLLSLPLELIYVILSFCSNATLVTLSQTCTSLNAIALQTFFNSTRYLLNDPVRGILSDLGAPRETLDAVRVALFLKELSKVHWDFNTRWECDKCNLGEDYDSCQFDFSGPCEGLGINTAKTSSRMGSFKGTLFEEVANLRAIISRLTSVKHVCLSFHKLDSWIRYGTFWNRQDEMNRYLWTKAFVGLLDTLLDKGCQSLEVDSGYKLTKAYSIENSEEVVIPYTRTTWGPLKLERMSVHSEMLLLAPFYDWTLSLLTSSACADTLTNLSFMTDKISIPSSLLLSLDLPNLVGFEIKARSWAYRNGAETGRANFEDVAAFLGRHNGRLRKLYLYGVGFPLLPGRDTVTRTTRMTSVAFFDTQKPVLPYLESITAHPAYIVWLLGLAVSSPPESKSPWPSNTTLENLKSIVITSEIYPQSEPRFDYALFDEALKAIVRWRNGRGSARTETINENGQDSKKRIYLMLRFNSEFGVDRWFASHLPSSARNPANQQDITFLPSAPVAEPKPEVSILSALTHISTLTILTSYPVPKLTEETINNLPIRLTLI